MLRGGMLRENLKMSIENILGNRMRSFLTMLGIIIGVTAVIALITTVSGVTSYMIDQFSSLGAGSLTINITGTVLKDGLTETDLSDIAEVDNVEGVSPSVTVATNVVRNGQVTDDISVTGRNEQYYEHNADMVTYGRPLESTDMDGSVNVCVIDSDCAHTLFLGEDPLGQELQIGGVSYRVVGLCGEDDNLVSTITGGDSDGAITIPYQNALRLNGRNSITSLEVYMDDTEDSDGLEDSLDQLLNNMFNQEDDAYSIINMGSLLDLMNTMTTMMTALLAGIASIALLVGGIGIMNMMLVSVTERTREIGLRKALGAEPGVIQIQFLMESIILSLIGGIIGIIFGELISLVATNFIGTEFTVNLFAIALGFFFSLAVGMIFGWAPARNASRLNPIDALRSE